MPKICITSSQISGILMRELIGWAQASIKVGIDYRVPALYAV